MRRGEACTRSVLLRPIQHWMLQRDSLSSSKPFAGRDEKDWRENCSTNPFFWRLEVREFLGYTAQVVEVHWYTYLHEVEGLGSLRACGMGASADICHGIHHMLVQDWHCQIEEPHDDDDEDAQHGSDLEPCKHAKFRR